MLSPIYQQAIAFIGEVRSPPERAVTPSYLWECALEIAYRRR
ncbi:hypothetical protein [Nostoc sp. TCL26-01]|nr:hypothetical protein [Nostoc sp. TCL26-01]